jgi:hypothetical protein
VPREPFGVVPRPQGVRERAVGGASLRGRRGVEDRRAYERVSKRDASLRDRQQPRVLGRLEGAAVHADRLERFGDRLHLVGQGDRSDDERAARVG